MLDRRTLLKGTAAGAIGGIALNGGVVSAQDVDGEEIHLMLKGTGDPKLGTDARNKQAMLSQFSGSVTGNIKGSYRGNQIALVFGEEHDDHDHEDHPVQTDEAKVAGTMTLTSPDREVAQNSTYELLYEGWITDCCGHDFNFEGEFKTDRATGRFEGTQIEGQITSGTDLGWPMQIQLQGVQYEA